MLINKALIEIPPRFAGRPPVFPGAAESRLGDWPRATGLAEDVRRYGEWMRDEAVKRIGHLYPTAVLPDGTTAPVIAWIWARTVICPNPACRITMPLSSKWWLGKKKGKEAYIVPLVDNGRVRFTIGNNPKKAPTAEADGTVGRTGARCISCGTAVPFEHIRAEGKAGRLGAQLMVTVAQGRRTRHYIEPTHEHEAAALVVTPTATPDGPLPHNPRNFNTPNYGLSTYADLFTPRQLTALTTFSDLVGEARDQAHGAAREAGLPDGDGLETGNSEAAAYADAVATCLAFAVSRASNKSSSICSWDSSPKMEAVRSVFARQAIPMTWDFAEANNFGSSSGGFLEDIDWVTRALNKLPAGKSGVAIAGGAQEADFTGRLLSTDPPYYNNIEYSDLSDFFYVWLRRSLRRFYPTLLSTMLTPKTEELVANPYRHGGKPQAKSFFESGFEDVFTNGDYSADSRRVIGVAA